MAEQAKQQQTRPGATAAVHPTLVPELLGFSPQMLLDDIISSAAEAILQCLQAMEPFMQRWADARVISPSPTNTKDKDKDKDKGKGKGKGKNKGKADNAEDAEWDGFEAVEQGLVAFSTLLESHTDIAFDFFEAWSLRNIFAVPLDLPIVAPHQRGLDLDPRPEEEAELMTDIEDLRRRVDNQRRLRRMYLKALRISRIGRMRSERRLARLSYFSSASAPSTSVPPSSPPSTNVLTALSTLPPSVLSLFENAASLPHIDGAAAATAPLPDPSKRLWETGRTGYVNWAVQQLIAKSKETAPVPSGSTVVSNAVEQAERIGETQDVKALIDALQTEDKHEQVADGNEMDTS